MNQVNYYCRQRACLLSPIASLYAEDDPPHPHPHRFSPRPADGHHPLCQRRHCGVGQLQSRAPPRIHQEKQGSFSCTPPLTLQQRHQWKADSGAHAAATSLCLLAPMSAKSLYLPDTCFLSRGKLHHTAALVTPFGPFPGISVCLTACRRRRFAPICLFLPHLCFSCHYSSKHTLLKSQTCCAKCLQMESTPLCSPVQKHCWPHQLIGTVHSTYILYAQRTHHHCAFPEKTARKHVYSKCWKAPSIH